MSEELSILEDVTAETLSTLEALDDVADTVESVVLSLAGEEEREGYFALADEYEAYAETLADEQALRSPEENDRLLELEGLMEDAFKAILADCPEHIRKLHEAVRAAIAAEEEARA